MWLEVQMQLLTLALVQQSQQQILQLLAIQTLSELLKVAVYLKALQCLALAIVTLLLSSNQTRAAVGKVSQQTGPTEIVRNNKSNPSSVNSTLEMNDTVITAKSSAQLVFEDNTTVKMTEQSKLIIDDFVYDPKKGTGKLAVKVALGTARYISGQIAKSNPQSVNVQTPTASIAVRGTDFSMTVDELGRSLVVLLPSCDSKGCVTGAISVSNDAGTVFMDVAYQTTLVSSVSSPPTAPQILQLDQANINNLLIVSPPIKPQDTELQSSAKTALDFNFLNQDLLKYNELDVDELKRFKELDVNALDNNFLVNMLDLSTSQLFASQEVLSSQNKILPGYAEVSGIRFFYNEDDSKISLSRTLNQIAVVTVGVEQDAVVSFTQDGTSVVQTVNRGGTTAINIVQR